MGAILNISREAARDLEDNFHSVLSRELKGDNGRARDLARQLVERLDLSGYQIGREELHRSDEDNDVTDLLDDGEDDDMPEVWTWHGKPKLPSSKANDA